MKSLTSRRHWLQQLGLALASGRHLVRTLLNRAHDAAATAVVRAQLTLAQQLGGLSRWERRLLALGLLLSGSHAASAQAGVQSTLTNVKNTVIMIGQILVAIFMMIQLIKTVKKFFGGEPDAATSLMWLIGGILLFFGMQQLKDQIVSNTGGGAGGVQ